MPIAPQIIRTESGEELVVITRAEFDALRSRTSEDTEDAADAALFGARMAELKSGRDSRLPPEVSAGMLKGDSLLRALRRWRDMTQMHLAFKTGLAQGYLSAIEAGRKTGTPETLRKISEALKIDPDWIAS
jgi:DNA-binding XRE family transcriptional regulator